MKDKFKAWGWEESFQKATTATEIAGNWLKDTAWPLMRDNFFQPIADELIIFVEDWEESFKAAERAVEHLAKWLNEDAWPWIQKFFKLNEEEARDVSTIWTGFMDAISSAVRGLIEWLDKLIDKFGEVAEKSGIDIKELVGDFAKGVLGAGLSFLGPLGNIAAAGISRQHGGIVPGSPTDVVPTLLHGGERVVPRGGTDLGRNQGSVTINISGDVLLDSEERLNQLAERLRKMLGRQDELARFGVGF